MKKLLLTTVFFLFLVLGTTNAQHQVTSTENTKVVTHVIGNHYDVLFTNEDGKIIQEGQYYKVGDHFKPDGIWKLYDLNTFELITRSEYDKGEQIWIETRIDGELLRVDKMDLTVKRLEDRIAALEQKIKKMQD